MLLRFNGLRYSSARCTTLGYSLLCGATDGGHCGEDSLFGV